MFRDSGATKILCNVSSRNRSETWINRRRIFLSHRIWFAPPFVSILTSFQTSREGKKTSERNETQIWRRREKKCWYPVSMDTRKKSKAHLILSCESRGEFSLNTIASWSSLCVCVCWRIFLHTFLLSSMNKLNIIKPFCYQKRAMCSNVSSDENWICLPLLTHMPEKHGKNVPTDTFLRCLVVCKIRGSFFVYKLQLFSCKEMENENRYFGSEAAHKKLTLFSILQPCCAKFELNNWKFTKTLRKMKAGEEKID
jgi:hypothetical protein